MIRLFLFALLFPQLVLSQINGVTPQNSVLAPLMNNDAICKISLIQYFGTEEATIQTWDKRKNYYRCQSEFEPTFEAPLSDINTFSNSRISECDTSFVVKSGLRTKEFSYNHCNLDTLIEVIPVGATSQIDSAFYFYSEMNRLDSIVQRRNCADLRAIISPEGTLTCDMIQKKISFYTWDEKGRIIEVKECYQLWDGSEVLSNWFLLEYSKNEIRFLDERSKEITWRIIFELC